MVASNRVGSLGVGRVYVPRPKHMNRSRRNQRTRAWCMFGRQFRGYGSPVVAHMTLKTRKGTCPVEKQLFGMYHICMHRVVFKLSIGRKKKKEDEQN